MEKFQISRTLRALYFVGFASIATAFGLSGYLHKAWQQLGFRVEFDSLEKLDLRTLESTVGGYTQYNICITESQACHYNPPYSQPGVGTACTTEPDRLFCNNAPNKRCISISGSGSNECSNPAPAPPSSEPCSGTIYQCNGTTWGSVHSSTCNNNNNNNKTKCT